MTTLQETIVEIEKQAIDYAINIAMACDSIDEFIELMMDRQSEIARTGL